MGTISGSNISPPIPPNFVSLNTFRYVLLFLPSHSKYVTMNVIEEIKRSENMSLHVFIYLEVIDIKNAFVISGNSQYIIANIIIC